MKRYLKCFLFLMLLLAFGNVQAAGPESSTPDDSDWLFAMLEQMDQGKYTQALKDAFNSGATPEEIFDVWTQLGHSEEFFTAKISKIIDEDTIESHACSRKCCGSVIGKPKFCANCIRVWCRR
ncbi:unnamed protein product, partial [marine sediment metagenome]